MSLGAVARDAAARRLAAAASSTGTALARVRLEVAAGQEPDARGLGGRARRALDLARTLGAPVGPALAAAAAADVDLADLRREIHVATAQARLVGLGLVGLPVVLLPGLDRLLGLPLVSFYATPAGQAVLVVAAGLLGLGGFLAWRMVAAVGRPARSAPADEVADLLAAALRAGLPASAALRAIAEVVPPHAPGLRRAGLALEHGDPAAADRVPIAVHGAVSLLAHAEALGVPASEALRELAASQRAEAKAHVRARAEQLPGRLALPSVLLLLPATVVLIGAPVVALGLAPA